MTVQTVLDAGFDVRTCVFKGGFEFLRFVEDGRMAYLGTIRDDTNRILAREPLLLREWVKLYANEFLSIAGS